MTIENKKVVRTGKNIYPDLTEEVHKNIKDIEKRFNIEISFLLDDGINIVYSGNIYEPDNSLSSFRLISGSTKETVIKIVENFGSLDFYDIYDKLILSIPILE